LATSHHPVLFGGEQRQGSINRLIECSYTRYWVNRLIHARRGFQDPRDTWVTRCFESAHDLRRKRYRARERRRTAITTASAIASTKGPLRRALRANELPSETGRPAGIANSSAARTASRREACEFASI
jgi:hypothetical protein